MFITRSIIRRLLIFTTFNTISRVMNTRSKRRTTILCHHFRNQRMSFTWYPLTCNLIGIRSINFLTISHMVFHTNDRIKFLRTLSMNRALHNNRSQVLTRMFRVTSTRQATFSISKETRGRILTSTSNFLPRCFANRTNRIKIPYKNSHQTKQRMNRVIANIMRQHPVIIVRFNTRTRQAVVRPRQQGTRSFNITITRRTYNIRGNSFLIRHRLHHRFPNFNFINFDGCNRTFFFHFVTVQQYKSSSSGTLLAGT